MVEDQKFSKVDLYGVGNMLITLLKQGCLTLKECDTILRRIAADSGLSELDLSLLLHMIHDKASVNSVEKLEDGGK